MLWTEKYKPTKASLLLSNTRSGNYLKEWLEEMKISPVTMSTERRMNEYYHDIFDDIKEVQVDPDDDFLPTNKTSRQANLKGRKRKRINMSSNMIMLVGDHGVGKTAAVYGTAEETCYDVFEIHPGMKRAGKDLMAAVGDMAENHQVIFDSTIPLIRSEFKCGGEDVSFEETNIPSEYKKKDIKKKSPNKDDPKPKGSIMSYLQKISKKKATDLALSNNQHAPQQALILLEEVDNLFEDDKGFWPAVTNLAQKSKRPIIMTCNDIKSVPVNKLSLQAILPFKAPDEKRLLPYLQLVCFSEGYLVYPHDLACLIDVIGCDLRQLIYTLEMWCKTQELPNVQDPGSDKKRFYKLQGLFEHIMGHSNGNNSLNPCLYTLHSTYHMSSISIGYDPKAYKSDSTNICVPCLKDKTKKDCLPVDLKSMQRLLSIGSSLDIWTKFSEKQSFKEGMLI
ncbi:P-loop containing nucleoside triphosphate hydrolase protein [Phycomyces blakesleeanus]